MLKHQELHSLYEVISFLVASQVWPRAARNIAVKEVYIIRHHSYNSSTYGYTWSSREKQLSTSLYTVSWGVGKCIKLLLMLTIIFH